MTKEIRCHEGRCWEANNALDMDLLFSRKNLVQNIERDLLLENLYGKRIR